MKPYLLLMSLFTALFLGFCGSAIAACYRFDVGCGGRLKRAADANTVELALSELDSAIGYAESKGLTTGTTAIILPTPEEDIGFWYQNLVASRDELRKLGSDASQLTRTNTLIKLRETLLDKTSSGEGVTVPSGISQHPHEALYAVWCLGSMVGLITIFVAWVVKAIR